MKGIKYILFGLMFVIFSSAILIDPNSNFGGFGELLLFIIGVGFGVKGMLERE